MGDVQGRQGHQVSSIGLCDERVAKVQGCDLCVLP